MEAKSVKRKVRKIDTKDFDVEDYGDINYGNINEVYFCNECSKLFSWITVSVNGYRCRECYSNDLDIIQNDENEINKFFRKRKLEKINAS